MVTTQRPIVKLPLTLSDKILEIIGCLLLLSFWAFTLYNYQELPEIIPTHFGDGGHPDGFGPKWTIISLPVVGTLLYIGLTVFSRFPHKMNYMTEITQDNAVKQYTVMNRMLRGMKIAIVFVFFLIDYQTVQIASGLPDIMGKWFLLIVMSSLFIPLFYFLIQSSKTA